MNAQSVPDGTSKGDTYDFRNHKLTETDQLGRVDEIRLRPCRPDHSKTVAYGTADAATTSYTYDHGGPESDRDRSAQQDHYLRYDAAGRMTSMKDAAGNLTQYGYDAKGQRTSMTDAKGRVTTYTYDARGRQLSSTFPDQHGR